MSEDDRDVDIESEDDDQDDGDSPDQSKLSTPTRNGNSGNFSQAEKRAHHNALERKRRDHIKDSFTCLREAVPSLQGEKASRAQILKKAAEYIQLMRRKNQSHQQDIDDLKKQNSILETQIRQLERAKDTYTLNGYPQAENVKSEASDTDDEEELQQQSNKKLKISTAYNS